MTKPVLKIDWATHEAAKYACENWHYSKCIPKSKLVKIGVWENDKFIGVVIFSYGSNINLSKPYNLKMTECIELTRIALTNHVHEVSKILSIAIRFLKKKCPGIKMVVSYADEDQKHVGTIYQANNWIYEGLFGEGTKSAYIINGQKIHPKTIFDSFGTRKESFIIKKHPDLKMHITKGKHRYVMPLDEETKKAIMHLAECYPKRIKQCIVATGDHPVEGGEIPTDTLQQFK